MSIGNIFRNYDIRGEYGTDLNPEIGEKIAKAFVAYAKPKKVVLGCDMRTSSPDLKEAILTGLLAMGIEVYDIGMVSTDVLYFSTWHYKMDGAIMVTASHMPKEFNGLKFLRLNESGKLAPIGRGLGMEELEKITQEENWTESEIKGLVYKKEVWSDFVNFVHSFVDINSFKPLKVIMDAGNGMGGVVAEKVFVNTNLDITPMFFEPDGSFPNHTANPILPENREDLVLKVKQEKADLGIAWDADCDRVYFIDENGDFVNGDFVTALLAVNFLEKKPGSNIVYDIRASKVVPDLVEKNGGHAHKEKVGHTYIKHRMRETEAIFGGEISGHYYFSDNEYMDSGFIPALMIIEMISKQNKTLSQLIKELGDYHVSGEINFTVTSVSDVLKKIEDKYSNAGDINKMDGISFEFDDWRFNVRPSANDPVLRLNLEAKTKEKMEEKLEEIRELIEN
ncbi:phosphomannomutase/phosphoglucomutase [Patescibacteria group bacterium]|nr:phosphomannomutase/phosphoglucomutase [Patescibacteria group bacterium]